MADRSGWQVVVLLGAPGSGKTTIGRRLALLGYRFREWEPTIIDRWGSREAFVMAKRTALPQLHDEIRTWIDAAGPTAVLETTGLSDAPLLDEFERGGRVLVARLDVSEREARRRVAARPAGSHLTDDADPNRLLWQAFTSRVVPQRRVDLVIDTDVVSPPDATRRIAEARAPQPDG